MTDLYARGLRITPLDEDGRPLFTVEGDEVTFHRAGWYRIDSGALNEQQIKVFAGAKVRHVTFADQDEEVSPEVEAAAQEALALKWAKAGTLDLASLYRRALQANLLVDSRPGMDPSRQNFKVTGGDGSASETHERMVASDVRTKVADRDGDLPEVWLQHASGQAGIARVTRTATPTGGTSVSVSLFQNSSGPTEVANLRTNLARATLALDLANNRVKSLEEERTKISRANGSMFRDAQIKARDNYDHLQKLGRFLHAQANRVEAAAHRMTNNEDRTTFFVLCDLMVKLRHEAAEQCFVSYDADGKAALDPNADVPWGLREWALLASKTMEAQANWLEEIMPLVGEGKANRVLTNAVRWLREAIRDYPDDVEAVEQHNSRETAYVENDEAVRRLSHAMTEVANQLEARWPTMRMFVADGDAFVIPYAVDKLRRTVSAWTTEDQRRPWAEVTSDGDDRVNAVSFSVDTNSVGMPITIGGRPVNLVEDVIGLDPGVPLSRLTGDEAVAPDFPGLNLENVGAVRGPIEFRIQREVPAEVVEKLARTMQAAATALEATYGVGMSSTMRNIITHLRADSAPWTSDAQKAHPGEPVDLHARTHQGHGGCDHVIEIHTNKGCQVEECPCAATGEALRRYWEQARRASRPAATDPQDSSTDLKNGSSVEGSHGEGGANDLPEQVKEAMRDAKELLRELRGHVPAQYVGWLAEAHGRLTSALGIRGL